MTTELKNRNQLIMEENYRLRNEVINKVSPTFCTAKWLQSTIYLWNGFTHSCHHPSAHKVDATSVELNPKALHNTPIKFVARADMLNGIQTPECTYCWNIENSGDHLSDRTYKSISPWAMESLDAVLASDVGHDINPTYVEVAFENTCNLKCTYCTPDVSSKWMEEIERHGSYQLSEGSAHDLGWLKTSGRFPIKRDDYNPYVDAFWKWWPDLVNTLKVFRITGGEPLLSKHTWAVFEHLIDNPNTELDLAVNTNLCVPQKLLDKLVEYSNKLQGKVKSFEIYTSCEAAGKQAEYIRFGMDYNQFIENCKFVLNNTPKVLKLHFMVATNLLSVTTFKEFLNMIYDLRVMFNDNDAENRVPMMISYVRWPPHLNIRNLPQDIKDKYSVIWKDFVMAHTRQTSPNGCGRFYLEEIDQVERLIEFMNGNEALINKNMKDFYLYHIQYDERRNTSFDETFPELIPFFNTCQSLL